MDWFSHLFRLGCVVGLSVGVVGMASTQCATPNTAQAQSAPAATPKPLRLLSALPTEAQLVGFDTRRIHGNAATKNPDGSMEPEFASLDAYDLTSQRNFMFQIICDDTATKAQSVALEETATMLGWMQEGTATGRRIGQRAWGFAGPAYEHENIRKLIAVDGRCTIVAIIERRGLPGTANAEVTPADLQFVEDQTLACLDRLTRLGLTSRAPDGMRAALPDASELSGFTQVTFTPGPPDAELSAMRPDGLRLQVRTAVADSFDEANAWAKQLTEATVTPVDSVAHAKPAPGTFRFVNPTGQAFARGSWTGAKLGDSRWHSVAGAANVPQSDAQLLVQQGKRLVWVRLWRAPKNNTAAPALTDADRALGETLVHKCLARLAAGQQVQK